MIEIDGNNLDEYAIRLERTEKLCAPGAEWSVELDFDCPQLVEPWDSIVLYEEGTKVLTGYVSSIEDHWGGTAGKTVKGFDTWKRAMDGWNDSEYTTAATDTILGLVQHYLDLAGLSYSIDSAIDDAVPAGLVITFMPYSEIILDLCCAINAFVWIDADGVVHVGSPMNDLGSGNDIAVADNLKTMDYKESDYRSRNKVIVWGPTSVGLVRTDEDWAVVDHTMVYASPFCKNAPLLAGRIHDNLHTLEEVKVMGVLGDASRRVGQVVNIDGPDGTFDGEDICTTIRSEWNKNVGYGMTVTAGERCAIFGTGPNPMDGRDVIVATYECGVWRCMDIWEDTPHWYSLNTGIASSYSFEGHNYGSGFNCEWFIRDPFKPNDLAFLHTDAGILQTNSTDPLYVNWTPVHMNWEIYRRGGVSIGDWHFARIRSTIARQGAYWAVVLKHGTVLGIPVDYGFIALTNDGFQTMPVVAPTSIVGTCLWGFCNYGHQTVMALPTWHRKSCYLDPGSGGGLAAWHRNDHGCTVGATSSAIASNAQVTIWHGVRGNTIGDLMEWFDLVGGPLEEPLDPSGWDRDPDNIAIAPTILGRPHLWFCFGIGGPLDPPPDEPFWFPAASNSLEYHGAADWYKISSPHIPYDQPYNGAPYPFVGCTAKQPTIIYWTPGAWDGSITETTAAYPTINSTRLHLPWGSAPADCHTLQGSIGTYTPDRRKVYCFSYGKPSRFAISDDEGASWEERGSVPFKTSCFSGFPYSASKVYVGRDPIRDPSAPAPPPYSTDRDLIAVSWDRGVTWHDVTGDLWTQTRDMHKRQVDGTWLGTRGLVTIAPRYQ